MTGLARLERSGRRVQRSAVAGVTIDRLGGLVKPDTSTCRAINWSGGGTVNLYLMDEAGTA